MSIRIHLWFGIPAWGRSMAERGEAPIHIVPYDPSWPAQFERERALLADGLGAWIVAPIEHVGSTAVPGLAAKPVIDIMAPVQSLAASRDALSACASLGYLYAPYRSDVMHWFCKPSAALRTHHLHLVPLGSPMWTEKLVFRDYLRRNPAVAAEYAELKQRLARLYEFDRETYTDAKGPFIQRVVEAALATRSRA